MFIMSKKLFSIEKEGIHNVFRIFGIKIKFINSRMCSNNKILIHKADGSVKKNSKIKGLDIKFKGSNSTIELYEPYDFVNCKIRCKSNNYIKIGPTKHQIQNFNITRINPYCKVIIGKDFSIGGGNAILDDEPGLDLIIGDNCMFSTGILIRVSDGHTILNKTSGKPINAPVSPGGIEIGNRVWLGTDVCILKNVKIPDDTVVGIRSVVTKSFEEPNTIIAGIPAKVVKRNIIWDRRNTEEILNDRM